MVAEPQKKDATQTIPNFRPGDTVKVHIKVVEGESERVQVFEGTVISRRGGPNAQTFTVRKISFGVGVERTFPIVSPHIERIEVIKSGRVRRSRLYYLRGLTGKAARLNEQEVRGDGSQAPKAEAKPEAKPEAPAPVKPSKPESKSGGGGASGQEPRAMGAAAAK